MSYPFLGPGKGYEIVFSRSLVCNAFVVGRPMVGVVLRVAWVSDARSRRFLVRVPLRLSLIGVSFSRSVPDGNGGTNRSVFGSFP
eukprot:scaffold1619_cov292-Pavlova_lutheri.AAC.14